MKRAALFLIGLLFCLLPQAALADPDRCLEPGYLGHFDPRLTTPQPCEEITTETIRWRGGHATLRAVHPRSMPITSNPALVGRIRETAAAIGMAMDKMGGPLSLDGTVTILFVNYVSPANETPDDGFNKGDYGAAARTVFAHECPVTYYKDSRRGSGEGLVFVLAHEVFHCIQYRSWPHMVRQDWLVEGTAEYFAYLAKPAYAMDDSYITYFNAAILSTPFGRMDYPAVVFYLWMGHTNGPGSVREFIGGADSLQSSVRSDMWIEFAQAFHDGRIKRPGGASLPGNPRLSGNITINRDVAYRIPAAQPYTVGNITYVFERNKIYDISYTPRPLDTRVRWRTAAGGMWSEPLTSVMTCDGEQRYRVIWGATTSSNYGDMTVRARPAERAACACPAGTWQETQASLRAFIEQTSQGSGGAPRLIAGSRTLVLNPDHTGSFTYNSVESETPHDDDVWLNQIKTGGTHFTWKTVSGMLLTILKHGDDNLLTLHNHMFVKGRQINEVRRAGTQSIGHRYVCDAAGLHLTQSAVLSTTVFGMPRPRYNVDMHFVRIGGAPPPRP